MNGIISKGDPIAHVVVHFGCGAMLEQSAHSLAEKVPCHTIHFDACMVVFHIRRWLARAY